MSKTKARKAPRNSVVVEMIARYGRTVTTMRHRNDRRAKDARKSWRSEEHA
jgi:hypothetical protein